MARAAHREHRPCSPEDLDFSSTSDWVCLAVLPFQPSAAAIKKQRMADNMKDNPTPIACRWVTCSSTPIRSRGK